MKVMCTEKFRTLSQLRAEKIAFSPKPDGHTDGRTDISNFFLKNLPNFYVIYLIIMSLGKYEAYTVCT